MKLTQNSIIIEDITLPYELEFTSQEYDLQTLVVTLSNNGQVKQYKVKKGEKIPLNDLKAGSLEIKVDLIVNNESVKTWRGACLVKEIDKTMFLFDYLKTLEKRLSKLEEKHKNILSKE